LNDVNELRKGIEGLAQTNLPGVYTVLGDWNGCQDAVELQALAEKIGRESRQVGTRRETSWQGLASS
jgi:hypothetical protein